jgi:hypothetical protein
MSTSGMTAFAATSGLTPYDPTFSLLLPGLAALVFFARRRSRMIG